MNLYILEKKKKNRRSHLRKHSTWYIDSPNYLTAESLKIASWVDFNLDTLQANKYAYIQPFSGITHWVRLQTEKNIIGYKDYFKNK